jgi:hypothetical protein
MFSIAMLNTRELAIAAAIVIAFCSRFIDEQIFYSAMDMLRALR